MTNPIESRDPMEARRQCTARARSTGERCGNRPIPGGAVCRFHGGGAPAVKRRARLRLAELVDPAISTLARVMVKAEKDADKLRAAEAILDRAGYPRASRIEGHVSIEESREMLLQRILELREMPPSRPASLPASEIVDAEIVDDSR